MATKRRFVLAGLLVLSGALAWAASGIEVLSHTDFPGGIEVLSRSEGGAYVEALMVIDGDWIVVDARPVDPDTGWASLLFSELRPCEARITLRRDDGMAVADLTFVGGTTWVDTP
ncbi:MAG: hypothetical protein ACYTEZ_08275 [Planctomycetota bacterium]|jgi:hypothetical protein